jgi:hypothetical protein
MGGELSKDISKGGRKEKKFCEGVNSVNGITVKRLYINVASF